MGISASYQPWQASAGSPRVGIGSFLVMAYWFCPTLELDEAECTRATRR